MIDPKARKKEYSKGDMLTNEFLKLMKLAVITKSTTQNDKEKIKFFKLFFNVFSKLQKNFVNTETIQLLADIRFSLTESKVQEEFFKNMMLTADFWIQLEIEKQVPFLN